MPQPRWLKQQKFISHSSGGWKARGKVAGFVSGEDPLPGLQMAVSFSFLLSFFLSFFFFITLWQGPEQGSKLFL
jgi:hypothetical protein